MSYNLIYNKQFIKVSETEYCPIVLIGSSNCYETSYNGKERRERSWWNFKYMLNGKHYGTLGEMIHKCEEDRLIYIERNKENIKQYGESWGEYSDKHYGYYASIAISGRGTRGTTYGMYKGIFITGCKNALTIEELKSWGVSVYVESGYMNDKDRETHISKSEVVKSGDELKRVLKEMDEYYKGSNISVCVKYNVDDKRMLDIQKHIRRINNTQKVKKEKVKKVVNEYYIFKFFGGWFGMGVRNGFRYTRYADSSGTKRVYNEKEAKRFCDKLNKKYSNRGFEVEKIILEKPIEIFV